MLRECQRKNRWSITPYADAPLAHISPSFLGAVRHHPIRMRRG